MGDKKASDFDQDLLNLFDRYVHGLIAASRIVGRQEAHRWAGKVCHDSRCAL